jgi:glycerol-3-phosphate acyltransferase PlsX
MNEGVIIAIDAMGGDHAPDIVIEGLDRVVRGRSDVAFLVHGDEARLAPLFERYPAAGRASRITHASDVIGMEVKPSQALRRGKGTSMWNAIDSVKAGAAGVVVSAGNTGALMAIAMLQLRTLEGVHRPALVASWPTVRGVTAVLDVGANVTADAEQLVEFAVMGEAYARARYGLSRPSIGLLNVGSEDMKGHEEIREAARLIRERQGDLDLDFRGFIEGDDISQGVVDVVVTDGFTGNIALKTAEGTARLVGGFVREALTAGPLAMLGAVLASGGLSRLTDRMDPRKVNAGVFLGLNGIVVKSHGGTDAVGFATAVETAIGLAPSRFAEEVGAKLRAAVAHAGAPANLGAIP